MALSHIFGFDHAVSWSLQLRNTSQRRKNCPWQMGVDERTDGNTIVKRVRHTYHTLFLKELDFNQI